jgi:hypothetical protein
VGVIPFARRSVDTENIVRNLPNLVPLGVRRVGLHHVDIVVSSLERSPPFYRNLLRPLGYVEA